MIKTAHSNASLTGGAVQPPLTTRFQAGLTTRRPLKASASSDQLLGAPRRHHHHHFSKNAEARKNANKNLMAPKLKRKVQDRLTTTSSSDTQLNRATSSIEIYESINDLSVGSLASRASSQVNRKSSSRSNQSLTSGQAVKDDEERAYLALHTFTSENRGGSRENRLDPPLSESISAENHKFIQDWLAQRRLYSGLQKTLLVLTTLVTLVILAASIYAVVDKRFTFFAHLSNKLAYSSFNRLVGLHAYLLLTCAGASLVLDLGQVLLFVYIRRFLDSHDLLELDRIIVNQIRLTKLVMLDEPAESETRHLQIRGRTRDRLKTVKRSICTLTYMLTFFYSILFLAPVLFTAIYLRLRLDQVLEYELPQTLLKLIREYELQQASELVKFDSLVRMVKRNFRTHTVEEALVDQMHLAFGCCNYLNPNRFGEMAPASCNYERGCLKPTQEFLWAYLYFGTLALLVAAALKLGLHIVLYANYACLLSSKLIDKLYHFKTNRASLIEKIEEEDEDDHESKEQKQKRLLEIRRQKELLLEQEDAQEELARQRQEQLAARLREASRRQIEYERKLEREGRFEELEFERRQRQNEVAHLMSLHGSYEQLDR